MKVCELRSLYECSTACACRVTENSKIGLERNSTLVKQKGKGWVVIFSGLDDAPDPCLLPGSARLTLLCTEPRLAEKEQQLLKESYRQRL